MATVFWMDWGFVNNIEAFWKSETAMNRVIKQMCCSLKVIGRIVLQL